MARKKAEPTITNTEILSYAGQYLAQKIRDGNAAYGENAGPLNEFFQAKLDAVSLLYRLETGIDPGF